MVKYITAIYRKNETILILISSNRFFRILKVLPSLPYLQGGIVILGPDQEVYILYYLEYSN